jgi:Flp pilus assembly protein TadD
VLELDPSAHYAHFALGQSLKQLGRRSEARTHLRLAVALSPTSNVYAGALSRLGPAD